MSITNEQAEALITVINSITECILEVTQPIADVQAEGNYPKLPEPFETVTTRIKHQRGTAIKVDVFTAAQILTFADATVAHRQQQAETCAWHSDDDGLWQSACGGDPWLFEADGPTENSCKFCMHCGKPMTVQAAAKGGE
jgi:hypothetical protein